MPSKQETTAQRAEDIQRIIDEATKRSITATGGEQDLLLYTAGLLRAAARDAQKVVTKTLRARVAEIARGKNDSEKTKRISTV